MAAAAEMTATIDSGSIAGGGSKSSSGTVEGIYTATIVTTADWIIFDDFAIVKSVYGTVDSSGAYQVCVIDGTTTNKVTVTTTGASTFRVIGTPATE